MGTLVQVVVTLVRLATLLANIWLADNPVEVLNEHLSLLVIIIIIIILESAVQGRERVRTLYQSKAPNPTQPTRGRKKKIKQ